MSLKLFTFGISLFIIFAIGLTKISVVSAQERKETPQTGLSSDQETQITRKTDRSFMSLRDQREMLEKEMRLLEKDLDVLLTQQYWLKDEAVAKQQLKDLESNPNATKDEKSVAQDRIKASNANAGTALTLDEVSKVLDQKQSRLKEVRNQKD